MQINETFNSSYSFHLCFGDTLTTDQVYYILLTFLSVSLPFMFFGVRQEKTSVLEYFLKTQKEFSIVQTLRFVPDSVSSLFPAMLPSAHKRWHCEPCGCV